jgi:hypothetical protein
VICVAGGPPIEAVEGALPVARPGWLPLALDAVLETAAPEDDAVWGVGPLPQAVSAAALIRAARKRLAFMG